jgi:hypothetical protein
MVGEQTPANSMQNLLVARYTLRPVVFFTNIKTYPGETD